MTQKPRHSTRSIHANYFEYIQSEGYPLVDEDGNAMTKKMYCFLPHVSKALVNKVIASLRSKIHYQLKQSAKITGDTTTDHLFRISVRHELLEGSTDEATPDGWYFWFVLLPSVQELYQLEMNNSATSKQLPEYEDEAKDYG